MGACYFEQRHLTDAPSGSLGADIAKHLEARQHLGKTIIVCERPLNLMPTVRKQWLKLARQLQRERSSTVNAEKILRLTSAITHMHHMRFSIKTPIQEPRAHVFFVTPELVELMPPNVYSFYVTAPLSPDALLETVEQLPNDALLIDYTNTITAGELGIRPKSELQASIAEAWNMVTAFLEQNSIKIDRLVAPTANHHEQVDNALDTLLGVSHRFLAAANSFQHALELAQPARLTIEEQRKYDLVILLAHRVQALSPSDFNYRFTTSLNDEAAFFLHDIAVDTAQLADALAQAIEQHRQAGRLRLARALAFAFN